MTVYPGHHISSSWQAPSLRDVVIFGSVVSAGGLRTTGTVTRYAKGSILGLYNSILTALPQLLLRYITVLYAPNHRTDRPPPVVRYHNVATARQRATVVDPVAAWHALVRSRELHGICVQHVLAVRSDEAAYLSLAQRHASDWEKKDVLLYGDMKLNEMRNLLQISIVADPSIHNGEDTMVDSINQAISSISHGIVFSWP